jgi:hypothetical protein
MQPRNSAQGQIGPQGEERRAQEQRSEQPGRGADQKRMGQAQNRESAPQTGQSAGQTTGQNVRTTGRANLAQDKAAQVAQTLRASGAVQSAPNININNVTVGANLPGEVVINPLPPAIVQIVPEFGGYDYFVAGDEVVIVDPATREVVEIIEDVG